MIHMLDMRKARIIENSRCYHLISRLYPPAVRLLVKRCVVHIRRSFSMTTRRRGRLSFCTGSISFARPSAFAAASISIAITFPRCWGRALSCEPIPTIRSHPSRGIAWHELLYQQYYVNLPLCPACTIPKPVDVFLIGRNPG